MSELSRDFPRLTRRNHAVTSPASCEYNCIAWAAAESDRWWWPDAMGVSYWPPTAPREETLRAFESAYGSLGYRRCDTGELEPGNEKIAIYADASGAPTHAARQLPDGRWTSKCGRLEDIEHELDAFAESNYGEPAVFLKRRS